MRDRVEKTILLLVLLNFANEKNRVNHDSRNDQAEKDDAEDQGNDFPPLEDNPGDVQRHGQSTQAGAQRHEKCDFFGTPGNAHHRSLSDHTKRDASEKKLQDCMRRSSRMGKPRMAFIGKRF